MENQTNITPPVDPKSVKNVSKISRKKLLIGGSLAALVIVAGVVTFTSGKGGLFKGMLTLAPAAPTPFEISANNITSTTADINIVDTDIAAKLTEAGSTFSVNCKDSSLGVEQLSGAPVGGITASSASSTVSMTSLTANINYTCNMKALDSNGGFIASYPTSFTTNFIITSSDITDTSATLSTTAEHAGLSYSVTCYDKSQKQILGSSETSSVSMVGFEPSTEYQCKMNQSNANGVQQSSDILTVTTIPTPAPAAPDAILTDAPLATPCLDVTSFNTTPSSFTHQYGDSKIETATVNPVYTNDLSPDSPMCPASLEKLGIASVISMSMKGGSLDPAIYSDVSSDAPHGGSLMGWEGLIVLDGNTLSFDFSKATTDFQPGDYTFTISGFTDVGSVPVITVKFIITEAPAAPISRDAVVPVEKSVPPADVVVPPAGPTEAELAARKAAADKAAADKAAADKAAADKAAADKAAADRLAAEKKALEDKAAADKAAADLAAGKTTSADELAAKAAAARAYEDLLAKQRELDQLKLDIAALRSSSQAIPADTSSSFIELQKQINDLKKTNAVVGSTTPIPTTPTPTVSAVCLGTTSEQQNDQDFQAVCTAGIITEYRPKDSTKRYEEALLVARFAKKVLGQKVTDDGKDLRFNDQVLFDKEAWATELRAAIGSFGILNGKEIAGSNLRNLSTSSDMTYRELYRTYYNLYITSKKTVELADRDLVQAIGKFKSVDSSFELNDGNRWFVQGYQFALNEGLKAVSVGQLDLKVDRAHITSDLAKLM